MNYFHVEFTPINMGTLVRTQKIFEVIRSMKAGETLVDEALITGLLTESEKAYFWNPSVEERAEWDAHCSNTPAAIRNSAAMISPQWDLESMYCAILDAEYELLGIFEEDGTYFLAFNPFSYPYGGFTSLVAFLECFGHTVLGYDGGTGYIKHQARALWQSRRVSDDQQ